MADEYVKGLKKMKDHVTENAAKIRGDAKKTASSVKQAGHDLAKDARDLAKEAKTMGEGFAQEVTKESKEAYADIAKRVKKVRSKGY